MITVVVLIVFFLGLGALANGRRKPTRYDDVIYIPGNPDQTDRNLTEAIAAHRAGKPYASSYALKKIEADCAAARARPFGPDDFKVANPNAEQPARRLVRRHPMRPATLE